MCCHTPDNSTLQDGRSTSKESRSKFEDLAVRRTYSSSRLGRRHGRREKDASGEVLQERRVDAMRRDLGRTGALRIRGRWRSAPGCWRCRWKGLVVLDGFWCRCACFATEPSIVLHSRNAFPSNHFERLFRLTTASKAPYNIKSGLWRKAEVSESSSPSTVGGVK